MFRASVIPSYQRAGSLPRTLQPLADRDLSSDLFEVLVTADSCSDGTGQVVQNFAAQAPYRLRVVSRDRKNAAASRNVGARNAEGEMQIFLDDDTGAAPNLVRGHLAVQNRPMVVSVGYLKLAVPDSPSQLHLEARLWWQDRYREMRGSGSRFGYGDFFSRNCAIPATLFQLLCGFAEEFCRVEDYEFGFRLRGRLVYVTAAQALHHDSTDLFKWMRPIRDEGTAELRHRLFGLRRLDGLDGYVQNMAFLLRGNCDWMVTAGLRIALILGKMKLRMRLSAIVQALRFLNYWRGVANAIQSIPMLIDWVEEGRNTSTIAADAPSLDLSRGLESPVLNDILTAPALVPKLVAT